MWTMAIASTSSKIEDRSSMLRLNENVCNDSHFSSRAFAEFEQQPYLLTSIPSPLVSVEDLHDEYTAIGNNLERKIFSESIGHVHLFHGVGDRPSEIAHIMHGRVGSYPSNCQHLPISHDSLERGLWGEFASLGFGDLSDFWGDNRLNSHEMAIAAAVFPPQEVAWNEGSTSCTSSGDLVTATASAVYGRPPGHCDCSSSNPTWAETSVGEGNDLGCPRSLQSAEHSNPGPLQPAEDNKTCAVVTSGTSVGVDPSFIYYVPTRPPKSDVDVALHLSSSCQPEIPGRALSPSLQPLRSRHPRSLESGVQDAAPVKHATDTDVDPMVSGTHPHNVLQQAPSLSMSSPPDTDRRRQADECSTGGKAQHFISEDASSLKLKKTSNELSVGRPASRKYQRRRAVNGVYMDHDRDVKSVRTPLDHVQRERQRRDLMNSRIAELELLLPKSPKRDKVAIVYDAIHLVKSLEREVIALQRRLHDLHVRKSSSAPSAKCRQTIPKSIDCNMGTRGKDFSSGVVIERVGKYMKPVVISTHPTWGKRRNSRPRQQSSMISAQCIGERNILDRGAVLVEFLVNLDDIVTIQEEKLLKCRCRMDYLSMMMRVVDEFRLDIMSCNILKLSGYFLCIVGLKTRTTSKEKTTAAQFAVRLQSVVGVDVVAEQVMSSLLGAKTSDSLATGS